LAALACGVTAQNTATNEIQPCTYDAPSGSSYDLTSMIVNLTSSSTLADLYQGTDSDGYRYYANVCNVVTSDTGCPGTDQTTLCQVSSSGSQATACGVVTMQSFYEANSTNAPDGGVTVFYTGGKTCSNGVHTNRTAVYEITCVSGSPTTVTSIVEDYCWYYVYMNSDAACPVTSAQAVTGELQVFNSQTSDVVMAARPGALQGSDTMVAATSTEITVTGVANGIAFSDGGTPLVVETLITSTQYSTSLGICTVGQECTLGAYTILLQITADNNTDDSGGPAVCLQGASAFLLDDGAAVGVSEDCLLAYSAADLAAVTVLAGEPKTTFDQFAYWEETASLTYFVQPSGSAGFLWTQQCTVDGEEATCQVVNPLDGGSEDSFAATLVAMVAEAASSFLTNPR